MKTIKLLFMTAFLLTLGADPEIDPDSVFRFSCIGCHDLEHYRGLDYDLKLWQLIIADMRNYTMLDDEEADALAVYMSSPKFQKEYFPEDFAEEQAEKEMAGQEQNVSAGSTEKAEPEIEKIRKKTENAGLELAELRKIHGIKRFWIPSRPFLRFSRYLGYASVLCLVFLAVTGIARKKLQRRFKLFHRSFAYMLIGAVGVHSFIYLCKFGAQPVLWLWFGIFSALTLLVSEGSGEFKHRLKRRFRLIHFTAGLLCIAGTILHWIWAWL